MFHRISTHVIAFALGTLALSTLQGAPAPPQWVLDICGDASPCSMPTEAYQGIALSIQWLETDGTPCPSPSPGQHPQSACLTSPASIAHWFALTRGGPHHVPAAVDHDVFVATDSPIYSAGEPSGIPGTQYAYGAVLAFGLPPTAEAQSPATQLPVLDADAWRAWLRAEVLECIAEGVCPTGGGGGITQTEFDALLATSPYASHNHGFSFTLTRPESLDGVTHNGITSVPQ